MPPARQKLQRWGQRQGRGAWRRSEQDYPERRREEHWASWRRWHLAQAASLEATAARLAAKHREKARSLDLEALGEEDPLG